MRAKKVYCIIVTYNGIKWLEKCLSSLSSSRIPVQVLIIDNGSTDESTTYVRNNYSQVELIETHANLGFGKANNIGMRKAYDYGADYFFLLNQDAWIDIDAIRVLVEMAEKNPVFGILSPMHLNGNGDALDYNFSNYLAPSVCKNIYSDIFIGKAKNEPYSLPFVNAAAWLISKKCVEIVGGFSPSFFHYAEDDNYCHRVLFHGLRIGVVIQATIYHDRENTPRSTQFINYEGVIKRDMILKYSNPNLKISYYHRFIDISKEMIRDFIGLLVQFRSEKIKTLKSRIKVISQTKFKELKRNKEKSKDKGMNFL